MVYFSVQRTVCVSLSTTDSRSQWPRVGRSPAETVDSNPTGGMDVCCESCVLSEVSATDLSLVQRSPTDCGASLCVI